MTRKTIYRTLLATLLLPNFTAYWWMLPRKMKRCRTAMQATMQMSTSLMAKMVLENWRRSSELMRLMASPEIAPISEREFRIPFQVRQG